MSFFENKNPKKNGYSSFLIKPQRLLNNTFVAPKIQIQIESPNKN